MEEQEEALNENKELSEDDESDLYTEVIRKKLRKKKTSVKNNNKRKTSIRRNKKT